MSHQTARSGPCGLKDGHGGDHRTPQGVEAANARNASPEGKARKARYNARYDASPEGKARKARYDASPKGKARNDRYDASPKGKARNARYDASPRGCHTARVWGMRYNNRSRRAALEVRYEEERLEIRERLQPVDSRGVRDAGLEG
jgi:predicted fused transcriptional regulator/phosphomethylpyrimidine kinase